VVEFALWQFGGKGSRTRPSALAVVRAVELP
jgi:hypothetical protein